jgi:DNA-binding response OmpR family regulator
MARILVLDDDKLFGALMRRALEQRGHDVVVAETAAAARELIASSEFDALVCDIILPDDSGLHVLRNVRESHPALATIAISGGKSGGKSVPLDVLNLAQTIGVDAIVKKPIELTNFVTTVEGALARKGASTKQVKSL